MTKQEIAQKLTDYIKLAFITPQNTETGFLTCHGINSMTAEQIKSISSEVEAIITIMVQQIEQGANGNVPTDDDCVKLFQYIFDKVTEVALKMIMDKDIDTQFHVTEAFDYYEPDLPEYIQLKLTNVVGKVAIISDKTLQFLDENNERAKELDHWMTAYLMVPAIIAIQFAQEIDLNDDSEMHTFIDS